MENKVERRGGRREGAGRKPVDPAIRKAMPTFRMEKWFLDYMTRNYKDPAKEIMECVCNQKGLDRKRIIASLKGGLNV